MDSSIQESDGIWKQLLELRSITELTGTVHEAQVQQLKIWAHLALPHADDTEIAVGLPHLLDDGETPVDLNKVEYRAKCTEPPPADLKNRLEGLDRSIKSLLGDYFETVVIINSMTIFLRKGSARKKETFRQIAERLKKNGKPASGS